MSHWVAAVMASVCQEMGSERLCAAGLRCMILASPIRSDLEYGLTDQPQTYHKLQVVSDSLLHVIFTAISALPRFRCFAAGKIALAKSFAAVATVTVSSKSPSLQQQSPRNQPRTFLLRPLCTLFDAEVAPPYPYLHLSLLILSHRPRVTRVTLLPKSRLTVSRDLLTRLLAREKEA
jgi:hypothetical protein